MQRDEFERLVKDQRVRDRQGRRWTVRTPAYFDRELGDHRVVLFDGAVVRNEQARFADVYEVVEGDLVG